MFLRILGTASLLALGAVFMPYSWMDAIHQWLGLGVLPTEPIVGYLARSTSAFYTFLGGMMWVVSFDLYKHRLVLIYIGAATTIFGAVLFVVDLVEDMPLWWSIGEGLSNVAVGVVILVLSCRIGNKSS